MQRVFDQWKWAKFQHILKHDPEYHWGLTHGDFHSGQLMYNLDSAALVLLDWEFSGIFGNPAIDLATWMFGLPHTQLEQMEDELLHTYYDALVAGGVDSSVYTFEHLYSDYRIYGFAQNTARFIGLLDGNLVPVVMNQYTWFVNKHNLTPEEMSIPMYGWF